MSDRHNGQIHVGLILFTYVACFGVYSLVDVPFWDDWVLLHYGSDGLWELFKQTGRREHYFIIAPLVAIGQPIVWSAVSFICWGIVALCVYYFLQQLHWHRGSAFWAALLTAAMPLNQARFALAMTSYSICAATFSLGMVFLALAVRRDHTGFRIVGAMLLTFSFSTNSFLTMSWLAPATVFLILRYRDERRQFWSAVRGTFQYPELFILPVAYWFTKAIFQPVYGLYAG
ncbi:MAG: hypothetical protein SXG53_27065, partial [Pseudomonadota bacterium]|nr:hypothetical protein [Pseudomonadota bacterium]